MPNRHLNRPAFTFLLALTAALGLAATVPAASGEVRLPKIFSSHMVLQRDRPVHVWGWSEPDEQVSATLHGAAQTARADKLGRWDLYLPPQAAGGPFQLSVTSGNTPGKNVTFDDVLIGDVWFASGQSNMEMPLNGFPGSAVVKNAEAEIRDANHPNIRLLLVPHKTSAFPLRDFDGNPSWKVCSPENARSFSAAAYFFGREIAEKERVPVGLIDSTWGGTPAEAWVSLDWIAADASLMPVFAAWAQMSNEQADIPALLKAEQNEDAAARAAHAPVPVHPWHPEPASWHPAWLYNGLVAPAVDFPVKGVIWYQGESNSGAPRAPMYEKIFPALIEDWRKHWRDETLPFLFVQISSFEPAPYEHWPVIREAQRRTLALANTAMAVTIDIGETHNVHPADKQTVGARLAIAARTLVYGENVEYSGPLFRQATAEPGGVRVWFDHSSGLTAKGSSLQGFEIAGSDGRFVDASARIEGRSVLVTSAQIERPAYVRYGWRNAPTVNLYNSAGLPASPFTSEDRIPAP